MRPARRAGMVHQLVAFVTAAEPVCKRPINFLNHWGSTSGPHFRKLENQNSELPSVAELGNWEGTSKTNILTGVRRKVFDTAGGADEVIEVVPRAATQHSIIA